MKPELLLIDDDPFALALSKKAARCLIAVPRIRIFSCAKNALEYLAFVNTRGNKIGHGGIICSDLEMPEIDGFAFLDEFGRLPREIQEKYKVFILSSTTDQGLIAQLYERRCFEGFFPKPLTAEKLRYLMDMTGDR